jgi:hypothetical protein
MINCVKTHRIDELTKSVFLTTLLTHSAKVAIAVLTRRVAGKHAIAAIFCVTRQKPNEDAGIWHQVICSKNFFFIFVSCALGLDKSGVKKVTVAALSKPTKIQFQKRMQWQP